MQKCSFCGISMSEYTMIPTPFQKFKKIFTCYECKEEVEKMIEDHRRSVFEYAKNKFDASFHNLRIKKSMERNQLKLKFGL